MLAACDPTRLPKGRLATTRSTDPVATGSRAASARNGPPPHIGRLAAAAASAVGDESLPMSTAVPSYANASTSSVPEPQKGSYTTWPAPTLRSWTSRAATTGLVEAGRRAIVGKRLERYRAPTWASSRSPRRVRLTCQSRGSFRQPSSAATRSRSSQRSASGSTRKLITAASRALRTPVACDRRSAAIAAAGPAARPGSCPPRTTDSAEYIRRPATSRSGPRQSRTAASPYRRMRVIAGGPMSWHCCSNRSTAPGRLSRWTVSLTVRARSMARR